MTYEDGLEHLQQLPGIGPFSAELILIRGAGNPDALPDHDTRLDDAIRSAYSTSDDSAIHQITESWRAPTEPGWRSSCERGARPRRARSPGAGAAQRACNPPTQHQRRHPARLLLARTSSTPVGAMASSSARIPGQLAYFRIAGIRHSGPALLWSSIPQL